MNLDQRYQATLDYIYSFVENSLTHQDNLKLEDSDLSRMKALVGRLGNPQNDYPTIHVAGSKGKGSVSVFCATALEFEGYKVGLFTSPHLRDFEERIQINREPIPRDDLVDLVDELKPIIEEIPGINTFEIITALAFQYFVMESVDIAVIEVGLGGRLDATNVITPLVSVITPLYLEHTYILGNTIQEIAWEKAGIIKSGIPVVISPQTEDARRTVVEAATKRGSSIIEVGKDIKCEGHSKSLEKQSFTINSNERYKKTEIEISLLGQHQIENATTAFAALMVLKDQGVNISKNAIVDGFANTSWPARFEILNLNPPIIVDSAHNPDSARKINQTIDEYFPGRPTIIIFGVSEDKDIEGMINEFIPGAIQIICTQSTHPRAMDVETLVDRIKRINCPISAINPVSDALDEAVRLAGTSAVILVTGSIFVAATARIAWLENMKNTKQKMNL